MRQHLLGIDRALKTIELELGNNVDSSERGMIPPFYLTSPFLVSLPSLGGWIPLLYIPLRLLGYFLTTP